MKRKFIFVLVCAVVYGVFGAEGREVSTDAYRELMPEPRFVETFVGVVPQEMLQNVSVVRDVVPDAPEEVSDQAYVLEIGTNGVKIVSGGVTGERWARATLAQLRKLSGGILPCGRVTDWPMLRWRGFMMDTARNYLDLPSLKDVLDMMARYKLNLFHWHITEYFGWRLASEKYPQIAEKGYYDPFGHRHRGKFYSQSEFREIVNYAEARGITIMPEFDVPGHSQAFREAFGFKTMKDPGVREVIVDLINELCSLAPKEKMPFIHLGGDEVWDEWEKIDEETMSAWAAAVNANGRAVVTWHPGQKFQKNGTHYPMLWSGRQESDVEGEYFGGGTYIEHIGPFDLLNAAAYSTPLRSKRLSKRQLGTIFCDWHDSAVGLPYSKRFREVAVFPAIVMLGDLYWHGRDSYEHTKYATRRLPFADDPVLDIAREIERRTIAQRDKVLTDLKHPFPFVRQTQMRWRLTDKDGSLIAKDIAQASIYPYNDKKSPANFTHSPTGHVYAETWIKSPSDRMVGAWIGFTEYDRDIGRSFAGGTPKRGEWNRHGAWIELNGIRIAPPVWEQPGIDWGQQIQYVKSNYVLEEIPYTNDEWYMREPTQIRLKAGWNHVRMYLPMPSPTAFWAAPTWVGTFMPVAGTTDHPHEIDGFEYSSEPPEEDDVISPDRSAKLLPISEQTVEAHFSEPDCQRAFVDVDVHVDMSRADGLEFEFQCEDPSLFSRFMIYYRSGDGWYPCFFSVEDRTDNSGWQKIRIGKSIFREGNPAGWDKIDGLRIAGNRAGGPSRNGCFSFRNFSVIVRQSDVVVLVGEWNSQQRGSDGAYHLSVADGLSAAIERVGVPNRMVTDLVLSKDELKGVKLLVLPYNNMLPKGQDDLIADFVRDGGKLFVCYTTPGRVAAALGVSNVAYHSSGENGMPRIAGMLRNGQAVAGMPESWEQASGNANEVRPTGKGEVWANWMDKNGKSLGWPSLLRTPTGCFMGHVWIGGSSEARDRMLGAVLSDLLPEKKRQIDAVFAMRDRKRVDDRRYVEALPGKSGERRLAWCEKPYGLGDTVKDWDSAVKLLKDNGFTDLIANVALGDISYYRSDVLLAHSDVKTRGDAFDACLAACRKHGVKFHAWMICWNSNGHAPKEHVAKIAASGRSAVSSAGKVWAAWMCPSHPENRNLTINALIELAQKGADGVHLDYIRYPHGGDYCHCDGCKQRFAEFKKNGGTWSAFRHEQIDSLVKTVSERIHHDFPGVEISIAARQGHGEGDAQNWPMWCEKGYLDFICPMDYTSSSLLFANTIAGQAGEVYGVKLYPGIGVSCWNGSAPVLRRTAELIMACRKQGLEGFTLYQLDAEVAKLLPLLRMGPLKRCVTE